MNSCRSDISPIPGVDDGVRTNHIKYDMLKRIAHDVRQSLDNEDGEKILANIRTLRETFEPETIVRKAMKRDRKVDIHIAT
jgi:hypothetical protein